MQENIAYNLSNKSDEKELPDFENLVKFFVVLLKVDMRINPQNYKPNTKK